MKTLNKYCVYLLAAFILLVIFFFTFIKFSLAKDIFIHGDRDKNQIALTFDDGPSPETLEVLKVLKDNNITATFFLIGKNIEKYPNITDEIIKSGNQVGIHSYSHKLSLIFFESGELNKTQQILLQHNYSADLFRPPYGRNSFILYFRARSLGIKTIQYDVETRDYRKGYTPQMVYNRVLSKTENGSILDFHDPLPGSAELMKNLIPELKTKYQLVNVSTLLNIT